MTKVKKTNIFFMVVMMLIIGSEFIPRRLFKIIPFSVPKQYSVVIFEFILLFIPAIIFTGVIRRENIKKAFKIKLIPITDFLLVIVLGFLFYPIMSFLGAISQLVFHNFLTESLTMYNSIPLWQMVLIIAGTPAICEESIMRGAILSGYEKVDIKKAALMNGLFFGLFHLNPQQFFYAFGIGVLFAFLVHATGSILSSMTCHFIINGTSVVLSAWAAKAASTQTNLVGKTKTAALIVSVIFLFFMAAAASVVIYYILKYLNERRIKRNDLCINDIGYNSNAEYAENNFIALNDAAERKVFDWSIIVIFVIYFGFLIAYQMLTGISMIN